MIDFLDSIIELTIKFCIFITAGVLIFLVYGKYKETQVIPHAYQHKSTICKTAEHTECGVYLKECENGKTYACLNELTIVRGEK